MAVGLVEFAMRSIRLLILSRYDEHGASSRLRTLQFIPYLEENGFDIVHQPLFGSAYLNGIYGSSNWLATRARSGGRIAAAMARRLWVVLAARQYDLVWVEKELFPYLPGWFEGALARANIPYVVDYDDAIFHRYDLSGLALTRKLLSTKLDPLLGGAYAVTVGNDYLAEYAKQHGARRVAFIPTVIDINRYSHRPERPEGEFRVGWIGSPSTAPYLRSIHIPLRQLVSERPIRLVTVGAPPMDLPGVPLEQHDWTLDSEAQLIGSFHIGIMPLSDTPWERGKCGYKLIQYMACGRPVVATPVGVNVQVVSEDVGFLATTDLDWLNAFRALAEAPTRRAAMGQAGRLRVEKYYTQQLIGPQIAALLTEAVTSRRRVGASEGRP